MAKVTKTIGAIARRLPHPLTHCDGHGIQNSPCFDLPQIAIPGDLGLQGVNGCGALNAPNVKT